MSSHVCWARRAVLVGEKRSPCVLLPSPPLGLLVMQDFSLSLLGVWKGSVSPFSETKSVYFRNQFS